MTYNIVKLVLVGVLSVVLVAAIIVDANATTWAVPLLTLLVGYVIGNSTITSNAPIVKQPPV